MLDSEYTASTCGKRVRLAGRSHTLMYWKVATSFINGEASVNEPSTFSFDVLDRLLLQAFQAFPALATVTVTVHTRLSGVCHSNKTTLASAMLFRRAKRVVLPHSTAFEPSF